MLYVQEARRRRPPVPVALPAWPHPVRVRCWEGAPFRPPVLRGVPCAHFFHCFILLHARPSPAPLQFETPAVVPPVHDIAVAVLSTPVVRPALDMAKSAWNSNLLSAVNYMGSRLSPPK